MNHRQNRNPNMSDFRLPSSQLLDSARIPSMIEINSRTERILAAARNALSAAERNAPSVVEQNPQLASLQQDDFKIRFNQSDSLQRRSPYEPIPLRPGYNSGLQNKDESHLFQKQKQSPSLTTAPQQQQKGGASSLQQDDFQSQFNQYDSLHRRSSYEPIPLRPGFIPGLQNQDMSHLLQKQNESLSLATAPQQQQQARPPPLQQDDFQSRFKQYDSLKRQSSYQPTSMRPGFIPGLQNQDMSLLLEKKKKSPSFANAFQQQQQGGASSMSISSMQQRQQSLQQQKMALESLLARQEEERLGLEGKLFSLDNPQKWPNNLHIQGPLFEKIDRAPNDKVPRKRRAKIFPVRLMETITAHYDEDIVSWLPDGRWFVVLNPDLFIDLILKKTFKDCKYASFVRKLNRWGFARVTSGVDCFYHPMDLCAQMLCEPRNESVGKRQERP